MSEQQLVDRAVRDCLAAAGRLQAAGVAPEALAEYVPAGRRLLVFSRPATMRPLGEVWRLGTLLLGTDGTLHAVGRATRAAERGRPGYQSASREERRELAAAALHGGYPAGAPVNFDAQPIQLADLVARQNPASEAASLPIGVRDGEFRVRWRPQAPLEGAATLEQYLAERVELLVNPPLAAT